MILRKTRQLGALNLEMKNQEESFLKRNNAIPTLVRCSNTATAHKMLNPKIREKARK